MFISKTASITLVTVLAVAAQAVPVRLHQSKSVDATCGARAEDAVAIETPAL
ncbi:hypothetical protein BG005_003941, partial [Podila minutissima]